MKPSEQSSSLMDTPNFTPVVQNNSTTASDTSAPSRPPVLLLETKEKASRTGAFFTEPILSNYLKKQCGIPSRKGIPRSVSENVLIKADQLFAVNWSSVKNMRVHVKGKLEASDSEESTKEESLLEMNSEDQLIPQNRKVSSAPFLSTSEHDLYQIFDMDNVFQKLDSLRSGTIEKYEDIKNAENTKSVNNGSRNRNQSRARCPKTKKIEDLEAQLQKANIRIKTVTALLDEVRHENTKLEIEKSTTTKAFQDAIDQLVADIIRLEDESKESNLILSQLWEDLQVAEEASRHRRQMLTKLRQEHEEEIKILDRAPRLRAASKYLINSFLEESDEENSNNEDDDIVPELCQTEFSGKLERDSMDDIFLKIANITGERHSSPRGQGKSKNESEQKRMLSTHRWSSMPHNRPQQSHDLRDSILAKLTGVYTRDEVLFKITIEESTRAKSDTVRSISFELSAEEANRSLVTMECYDGKKCSHSVAELINVFARGLRQKESNPSTSAVSCSNMDEASESEDKVNPKLGKNNYTERDDTDQVSIPHVKTFNPLIPTKGNRSLSAPTPPNQLLSISILSALNRVSEAQDDKRRLSEKASLKGRRSFTKSLKRRDSTSNKRPRSRLWEGRSLGLDSMLYSSSDDDTALFVVDENFPPESLTDTNQDVSLNGREMQKDLRVCSPTAYKTKDKVRGGKLMSLKEKGSMQDCASTSDLFEPNDQKHSLKVESYQLLSPPDVNTRQSVTPGSQKMALFFDKSTEDAFEKLKKTKSVSCPPKFLNED